MSCGSCVHLRSDYIFQNLVKCLCGSRNCRGFISAQKGSAEEHECVQLAPIKKMKQLKMDEFVVDCSTGQRYRRKISR
jgi:hypothetical protein